MRDTLTFRKNSWHYRLWRFTYSLGDSRAPIQTSLCAYVQRILWLTVPVAGVYVLLLAIGLVIYLVGSVWYLFLGSGYPNTPFRDVEMFERTDGLPVGRFRLYPYRLILPALAVWGLIWGFTNYPSETGLVLILAGAVLALVALVLKMERAGESDLWYLITEYLQARKERICPLIEFSEDDPSPPSEPDSIREIRESGFEFGDRDSEERGNPY